MIQNVTTNLNNYKSFIANMANKDFCAETLVLSGSSIGQHLRHVLEFYLCLFSGIEKGEVCYDERKRDLLLETDKGYAVQTIDKIIHTLCTITTNAPIKLKASLSSDNNDFKLINSSIYRELVYCFDHSVHHQALIKIGLKELNCEDIDQTFGVAPSTIKYRKECAQ
ncbi:MAG: hypothetical protein ACJA0Q_001228 [Saprospiraceae bacterium]|jgi:hypothetical protein